MSKRKKLDIPSWRSVANHCNHRCNKAVKRAWRLERKLAAARACTAMWAESSHQHWEELHVCWRQIDDACRWSALWHKAARGQRAKARQLEQQRDAARRWSAAWKRAETYERYHRCRFAAKSAHAANERIATLEGLLRRWDGWAPIVKDSLLHDETRATLGEVPAPTEPVPSQAGETALFDTTTPCETCANADRPCAQYAPGLRGQSCKWWQARPTPIDTREVDVMEWEGGEQ
jgi:hypothetical protein